jgi:hypothetical protein
MKLSNLTWGLVQQALVKFLREKTVKFALKKILGSAVMGGPVAWAVKFVVVELFDEFGKKIIDYAFQRAGYYHDVRDGIHTLKRIENAETRDEWRDSVRDS